MQISPQPPIHGSLNPYSGPWTIDQAAHLLRRTTFGPTKQMIDKATNLGLNETITELFIPNRLAKRPVNHNNANDPEVKIGETWEKADISPANGLNQYRYYSICAWYWWKMQQEEINILEKMVLFWHNHFVISDIENPGLFYDYFATLEKHALGSFKELTKDITINAGMLRFLNGNLNTKTGLNENYARELLELFTIGKGALAGPGDYTTFTEQDVREIAKSLTGWTYTTPDKIILNFDLSKHDTTTKKLSHRFNNQSIPNSGDQEYKQVVDIIFQQDECSRYIARELYRWFVSYHIDARIESEIIIPLATLIRNDNYVIESAVRTLLSSEHFYSEAAYGCMIKSPVDFIMSLSQAMKFPVPRNTKNASWNDEYTYFNKLWTDTKLMGQVITELPDVSGWKAYYQEPLYYRHWINAVSLQERKSWINKFIQSGITINSFTNLKIPVLDFIDALSDPRDINKLLEDLNQYIFPYPLTNTQIAYLKDVILNGLPEYEWTDEYDQYIANKSNKPIVDAIDAKVRKLFVVMLNLPEFLIH